AALSPPSTRQFRLPAPGRRDYPIIAKGRTHRLLQHRGSSPTPRPANPLPETFVELTTASSEAAPESSPPVHAVARARRRPPPSPRLPGTGRSRCPLPTHRTPVDPRPFPLRCRRTAPANFRPSGENATTGVSVVPLASPTRQVSTFRVAVSV